MKKIQKKFVLMYFVLLFNVYLTKAQTEEPLITASNNFKNGINKLQAFEIISKHLVTKTLDEVNVVATSKEEIEILLGNPNETIGQRIFRYEINQNGCVLYLIFDQQKSLDSFTLKNCN
jgi:folate-dependent phosphoribosylglycinamide formyltransferase PurN